MLRRITAPTRSALEVPIRSAVNELAAHHPGGAAGVIEDLTAGGWERGLLAQWADPVSIQRFYRRYRSDLLVFLNAPMHSQGRPATDRFPGWDVADPGAYQAPNQALLVKHAVLTLARDLLDRSQTKR
jgi:hypothetical protein